jgi:hypothetical protein
MASISKEIKSYGTKELQLIEDYILHSGAPSYSPIVKQVKSLSPVSNPRTVRRLSALADYEGKTRVIAIGDYLSNCLLKPLHDELMKCLKGLKSDYTHKQHTLSKDFLKLGDSMKPVSVDITAATDRIPVEITSHILGEYFDSPELGKSWQSLMVEFPFMYSDKTQNGKISGKSEKSEILYACGQPMGLYSS